MYASEAPCTCAQEQSLGRDAHVGYVHEAASLSLSMGVYVKLSTRVCAGRCGL